MIKKIEAWQDTAGQVHVDERDAIEHSVAHLLYSNADEDSLAEARRVIGFLPQLMPLFIRLQEPALQRAKPQEQASG